LLFYPQWFDYVIGEHVRDLAGSDLDAEPFVVWVRMFRSQLDHYIYRVEPTVLSYCEGNGFKSFGVGLDGELFAASHFQSVVVKLLCCFSFGGSSAGNDLAILHGVSDYA